MALSGKKKFLEIVDIEQNMKSKRDKNFKETRKTNREESLLKKRKEKASISGHSTHEIISEADISELDFVKLYKLLTSGDFKEKLNSTIKIRRFLSKKNPSIDEIIKAGMIPIFISFLKDDAEPLLQFEAAWIITNVASGSSEQTIALVNEGVIEPLINLLENPKSAMKEQCAWALGNIAGDSPQCREKLLELDIIGPLLRQMNSPNRLEFLRNLTWTLSNLCRGKIIKKTNFAVTILPILKKFIFSEDTIILSDVCWALSYLSDGSRERIQLVIDLGIVQRIVELLMHSRISIQTPALRILGNIATGDNLQTQVVINCGILPCLLTLLNSSHKQIKREACWTISNITAGNSDQIQSVINGNIIPTLIYIMKNSENDVKNEAVWAISNAATGATAKQIEYLVKKDCIAPMIDLLDSSDSRIIGVILDGFMNILEVGNQKLNQNLCNKYAQIMEQNGGLEKLENLQHHMNNTLYKKTVNILKKFFGAEDDLPPISFENVQEDKIMYNSNQIPECTFNFLKK
ncbi:importin alpha (nucleomorph) [Chroomonas mesostigmatica CCMP1168]|uniref:Importin subunit alpha n=1 Tax=Chroomonas mesostigmatica CCMP1168 TaxID=1195612 RepID=J7G5V1_9CRYP|nr:importin alpha [Chroomonas mesostigmatica CCMP1168]